MKGQTNRSVIESQFQRTLRNNMTDAEIRLWRRLRGRQMAGCKFRRQHPFLNYVLDFVCLEQRLVVEVDGGQHLDDERDKERDKFLQEAGFHVLRFWNNQVLQDIDTVAEVISAALQRDAQLATHPPPNLPLEGGGVTLPPLQGEGRGGDGEECPPSQSLTPPPAPAPDLP